MKRKFFQPLRKKKNDPNENGSPKKRKISFAGLVLKIKEMKNLNWFRISVIANIAVVIIAVVGLAGVEVIHQSDTNPNLCGLCHIMQPNVNSYQTSNHMDNLHMQAGVQCKDCHDYSVIAEISSGINFLIGNYEVNQLGQLHKVKYSDSMCYQCHISYNHIADQTTFLKRDPHNNHNGQLHCNTCHISHGEQIDYCSGCHENGGQRMIEDSSSPRTTDVNIAQE